MQNPRIAKIMQLCPNKPKFGRGSNIINSRTLENINDSPKLHNNIKKTISATSPPHDLVCDENTKLDSRNGRLKSGLNTTDLFELPVPFDDFPAIRDIETETSHDSPRFDLSIFKNTDLLENNYEINKFVEPSCSPSVRNTMVNVLEPPCNKENILFSNISSDESHISNTPNKNEMASLFACNDRYLRTNRNLSSLNFDSIDHESVDNVSPIFPGLNSDDSVMDKDYVPSLSSSDMEIEYFQLNTVTGYSSENNINETTKNLPLDSERNNAMESLTTPSRAAEPIPNEIPQNDNGNDDAVEDEMNEPSTSNFTKKGTLRKRRIHSENLKVRQEKQKQIQRNKYKVKPGCQPICKKKCSENFTDTLRQEINDRFWDLTFGERRQFIKNLCTAAPPQRVKKNGSRKKLSFKYFMKNSDLVNIPVCKEFFLTTLGYSKNNDKMLYNSLNCTENHVDKRGKHPKCTPVDKIILEAHILSYNPTISHHRREHAPKRSYLPSDITIKDMHSNFMAKHPDMKVSYEMYRIKVKNMNISFAKLGCEECEFCEKSSLHNPLHDVNNLDQDCNECKQWKTHLDKAAAARELYKTHKEKTDDPNHLYVSADLQKVIMLPRMDNFKEVIFCPRLIVLNESFVPLGKSKRLPFAALWHEAISGRKKEDITSTFHAFLLANRNIPIIDVWLDNCSGQNKNWLLYNYLVYILNSNHIATESIVLNYLQTGHTFMSADSFHHQVELAMGKKNKIYDFSDFVDCVQKANSRKVDIKIMNVGDFFGFKDFVALRRKNASMPYLSDVVQMRFTRGKCSAEYKTDYSSDYTEFKFLKESFTKVKGNVTDMMTPHKSCRGIESSRKNNLIKKIGPLMPAHYLKFWEELAETRAGTSAASLDD